LNIQPSLPIIVAIRNYGIISVRRMSIVPSDSFSEVEQHMLSAPEKAAELIVPFLSARDTAVQARAHLCKSDLSRWDGDISAAMHYATAAKELYSSVGDSEGLALSLTSMGQNLAWRDGVCEGLRLYAEAEQLTPTTNTLTRIRRCRVAAYIALGRIDDAIELGVRTLAEARDAKDLVNEATLCGILAGAYWDRDRLLASELVLQQLSIARKIDFLLGICDASEALGRLEGDAGRCDKAICYFQETITLAEQHHLQHTWVRALGHLLITHLKRGDLTSASPIAAQLERLMPTIQSPRTLLQIGRYISLFWAINGRVAKAASLLHYALELQVDDGAFLIEALQNLSEFYEELSKPRLALSYLRRYTSIQHRVSCSNEGGVISEGSRHLESYLHRKIATPFNDLQPAQYSDPVADARLTSIIRRLQGTSSTDHDLPLEEFVRALYQRSNLLTPSELTVCILTRQGLSSKQVAHVLSVSVRTVEDQRYRIRDKLQLSRNQSLFSFLRSI
jgi:DNA-binding CsgD family transcriptional regulator